MATSSQRRVRKSSNNASPSGRTLKSIPDRCIVCRRTRSEVDLHPYTSQKARVFCRRDHDITDAMRKMGCSMNTHPDATTAVAQRHLRLIEWLEDKLSPKDIAKVLIYVYSGTLPRG